MSEKLCFDYIKSENIVMDNKHSNTELTETLNIERKETPNPLTESSSDEDLDSFSIWSKRKKLKLKKQEDLTTDADHISQLCADAPCNLFQKFESLKKQSDTMKALSDRRLRIADERKARRQRKKAMKALANLKEGEIEKKEEWKDIKPFLTVNDHLHGPVSHGDCGPKTELECIIDDAIKEGDFERAEILSDTLANRRFAVKIASAFSAKRRHEEMEIEKANKRAKQLQKIPWTFQAKEKWQMKGNM